MDWCSLREVFPMLNSAQLHYLLEHYKLSVTHPDHWTPSEDDEEEAYNLGIVIVFMSCVCVCSKILLWTVM